MRLNKHSGFALGFIILGALILLNKMGLHPVQHILSFLFPAAMVGLGFLGLRNGRTIIGWILIGIGGMVLLGQMSGIFGIVLAIGLIVYGFSLLKRKSVY